MSAKRRDAPSAGNVMLPPGWVLAPIAGTVRYDRKGRALGVWGRDFPVRLHVEIAPGDLRPLTAAEERLARRMWRP